MKKRSDFEHKINAPGPTSADFARYAEYEMNLDTLRRKRVKRLGAKSRSYYGQRRVYSILDRATHKLGGDIGLWMQYIQYAQKQKAHKKLSQVLDNALRLHPMRDDLWIYAARYVLEERDDITEARGYMQRGVRFCKKSPLLWAQYGKLEMLYITRLSERVSASTANSTAFLSGAVPMAIFDTAMKHFEMDAAPAFARQYYDAIHEFRDTPCTPAVLERVVTHMIAEFPSSFHAQFCYVEVPVATIYPTSADFPGAFGTSLRRLKECGDKYPEANKELSGEVVKWLQPLSERDDLDPALHKVVQANIKATKGRCRGKSE